MKFNKIATAFCAAALGLMTLTAYNHGSRDLLTLQNSADSLLRAKTDRESHIYNLICAVLDLENTLGIPFGSLGDNK